MHVLKGNKYAFTFQASPFNLLESIQANLGVNWVSQDIPRTWKSLRF